MIFIKQPGKGNGWGLALSEKYHDISQASNAHLRFSAAPPK
jgi:hypothetical protein